jgi:HK97 family phage major capsid protein
MTAGGGYTLLGHPIVLNNALESDEIVFGKLDEYQLVQVGNVELFVDRNTFRLSNNATAFAIFARFGGRLLNRDALKIFYGS